MKNLLFLALLSIIVSCDSKSVSKKTESHQTTSSIKVNYNVALDFMNSYDDFILDTIGKISQDDFVKQNELLTDSFKKRYKTIIDSANRVEPEIGLDYDPILDAQDFPDKGFKIKTIDEKTGYVTLQGIDWQDFEVVLKVINDNNKSLVDGAGIINIPTNKQAKR